MHYLEKIRQSAQKILVSETLGVQKRRLEA